MKEKPRVILINNLIKKYNFESYLEIGIDKNITFKSINCKFKESVDPCFPPYQHANPTHKMTSDQFFNKLDKNKKWDIIFIDGLHHYDQVNKDIKNCLNHLNKNGFIVLHDCNPIKYENQLIPRKKQGTWNGDVWKSIVEFRKINTEFGCLVLDCDEGLGIISKNIPINNIEYNEIDYYELDKNREKYLGLIKKEKLYKIIGIKI